MPISELIGVAALAHPDLVVEIVAVAALPDNQARDSHQHISQARRATKPWSPPNSEHHKTGLSRLRHRLGPAVCVKLGEYRGDVKFGRVKRNTQPTSDRFV